MPSALAAPDHRARVFHAGSSPSLCLLGSIRWPKRPNDASSHSRSGPPGNALQLIWERPRLPIGAPTETGAETENRIYV